MMDLPESFFTNSDLALLALTAGALDGLGGNGDKFIEFFKGKCRLAYKDGVIAGMEYTCDAIEGVAK